MQTAEPNITQLLSFLVSIYSLRCNFSSEISGCCEIPEVALAARDVKKGFQWDFTVPAKPTLQYLNWIY